MSFANYIKQNQESANNGSEQQQLVYDVLSNTADQLTASWRKSRNQFLNVQDNNHNANIAKNGDQVQQMDTKSSSLRITSPWENAITPANIMEAMRRFEQTPNVWSRFTRTLSKQLIERRRRILCL